MAVAFWMDSKRLYILFVRLEIIINYIWYKCKTITIITSGVPMCWVNWGSIFFRGGYFINSLLSLGVNGEDGYYWCYRLLVCKL